MAIKKNIRFEDQSWDRKLFVLRQFIRAAIGLADMLWVNGNLISRTLRHALDDVDGEIRYYGFTEPIAPEVKA